MDFERVNIFTESFICDETREDAEALAALYKDAVKRGVPVIRPATRSFIRTILSAKQPMRALEIGTAIGYSALYSIGYMAEGAHLTTMELDEARVEEAKKHIEEFGRTKDITVMTGDAAELLKELPDASYDYVFVDAAKGQYLNYLPEVLRVTVPGSIILSDNIFQEGTILESRFEVERRDRTIHERIRTYLYELTHTDGLTTSVLPLGDGMALTVKSDTSN